ncbi:hypothetical protein V6N13_124285 [Hibiscus sabdariffa]
MPDFFSEEISDEGRIRSEKRGCQNADFVDMDDETKEMEDAVSESSGHHEAKVKGVVDDSAQWVPTFVVEPVPEIIKSILGKVKSGTVIEVGVEFMYHRFITKEGEKTGDEGQDVDETEDGDMDH